MVEIKRQTTAEANTKEKALILWFDEIGIGDIARVGGKNASLGEMIVNLTPQGIKIPAGFATTAYAYRSFLKSADLEEKLAQLFATLRADDVNNLKEHGKKARELILNSPLPKELEEEIKIAYLKLCQRYAPQIEVAVRSSATAEDLPDASFAGQQESYLNIHGVKALLGACHQCFASLFTDRAIYYRVNSGYSHLDVNLSVGVQKMVRSDLASSGVIFSLDPESGFKDNVLISASYGLGENIVQGVVNPDEYLVFKPTLLDGFSPILQKKLGSKEIKMICESGGGKQTKNISVPARERNRYALNDSDILELARQACLIEQHYSKVKGVSTPMDIEWAKDGLTEELYVVQARPETVQSRKSQQILSSYVLKGTGNILLSGRAVGQMIGNGKARIITDLNKLNSFQEGEVIVAKQTDPDWEPIMKKASAIITDQGGRTCHAAIVARELGIPAVVGCISATKMIHNGQEVTVSCAEGEQGNVYQGIIPYQVEKTELENLPHTKTQILLNVSNPENVFTLSTLPSNGVGLVRLEFIINNHIGIHPLALLHGEKISNLNVKSQIEKLTNNYATPALFFIEHLVSGIAMIAAAFYPQPVIVRMSDFKSNEYANLLGGTDFEPLEENPMLGWRGASRYYDPKYELAYSLECISIKKVRNELGLDNVIPMIPFCRTPAEGRKVIAKMNQYGLTQRENGLQVYMMCEIPSNIILAKEFSEIFDGFSIGSNDLTQLILGLDRDSALVGHLFDERNDAVKGMISQFIQTIHKTGKKVGICGQAPSDYPELAEFLVKEGIDSISLNPDSFLKTLLAIDLIEKNPSCCSQLGS